MNVIEIMTKHPQYAAVNDSVREALIKMQEYDIRHLPVLDNGELVGIISDRDIGLYSTLIDEDPELSTQIRNQIDRRVSSIMNTAVISVDHTDEVSSVIELMIENRVGAVPVVDGENGKLLGIISYIDILKAVQDQI